jgi:hypothetical protein
MFSGLETTKLADLARSSTRGNDTSCYYELNDELNNEAATKMKPTQCTQDAFTLVQTDSNRQEWPNGRQITSALHIATLHSALLGLQLLPPPAAAVHRAGGRDGRFQRRRTGRLQQRRRLAGPPVPQEWRGGGGYSLGYSIGRYQVWDAGRRPLTSASVGRNPLG